MKRTLAVLLLGFCLPALAAAEESTSSNTAGGAGDEFALRFGGALSFPLSSYVAEYLDTGIGPALGLVFKKGYWPLSMQFSAGWLSYGLRDRAGVTFQLIPVNFGLLYRVPLGLPAAFGLHAVAETGIAVELLRSGSATDANTAFTAALGMRATWAFAAGWEAALTLQYTMLSERDESASFLNLALHIDLRL